MSRDATWQGLSVVPRRRGEMSLITGEVSGDRIVLVFHGSWAV